MELTEKEQRIAAILKWGITIVAAAVLAPLAWLAVKGILGIAVAASIGLVGINAAPVIALKLANLKYRALDAEANDHIEKVSDAAAANPIETLIAQSMEKRQASDQFRTAINSAIRKATSTDTYMELLKTYFMSKSVAIARRASAQEEVYYVVKGDTLSNIAATKLGDKLRYKDIQTRNNLANPNFISPGQKLIIPVK